MKNHKHYHRCRRQLSALVRLALIAAVCTVAGWSGNAWGVDEGPRQKQQDGNTLVYYQPQDNFLKFETAGYK